MQYKLRTRLLCLEKVSYLLKFRIILARVGKTSMTVRFCLGKFDDQQKSTVNAACLEQSVRITDPQNQTSSKVYKLSIWDTAGQEQHHCLNTVYYRGA